MVVLDGPPPKTIDDGGPSKPSTAVGDARPTSLCVWYAVNMDVVMTGEERDGRTSPPTAAGVVGMILGSKHWGQKMGSEGSRLAESERGVWF